MATRLEYSYPSTSKSSVPHNTFLISIHNHFQDVLRYENGSLLAKARSCIPIETLQIRAIERMRNLQREIKSKSTDNPEMHLEEAFLVELMNWFKTSFFSWVDSPPCSFCSGKTKYSHITMRTEANDNIRIEIYKCLLCEVETEFPRYNDPAKLLITRKGRCGEWGNCFTLICRAMKYDARLVIDSTDHLWTEVYSPILKKWLHCDPCENVIDAPLMYEAGWGKKLCYIMAYSKDEVQDVTWKYSNNHKDVLSRRDMCTENELITTLMEMREKRWESLTPKRKKYVQMRLCVELVDMMKEREPTENEKQGRSSGALDWRLQRKEINLIPFVWKIGKYDEICIKYRTSSDVYEVTTSKNIIDKKEGWINGIFEMNDIFRKVESDWKMAYLARIENSKNAKVSWKFQTDSEMKIIKKINIKVSSQVYQNGKIEWVLSYKDTCVKIPKALESNFILDNISNLYDFTLSANLSGGEGSLAWQHTQIFRQDIESEEFPFQICITLKHC